MRGDTFMSISENKNRRYFGTDGIRDIANRNNMTPEFALKVGRAFVSSLKKLGYKNINILVGRDTRYSGAMIQAALVSGINSAGANVTDMGVVPTPGVSYTLSNNSYSGGVIISASHNPAEYNGIKLFNSNGYKLTDEDELLVEEMLNFEHSENRPIREKIGVIISGLHHCEDYQKMLITLLSIVNKQDFKITVDAANGAASYFVGPIFENWKANVCLLANNPNGLNINDGVGVTHMNFICEATIKNASKLGIAYDGDTDRVLMCDCKGRIIDGDIMLWILARWLASEKKLGSGVVATVMSNMILEDLLKEENIKVFRCGVGDRYVMEEMRRTKSRLGGEQSGHLIAQDYANTGDGLSSGILFLKAIEDLDEDISTLVDRFDRYPQILANVEIKNKKTIMDSSKLKVQLEKAENMLLGKGRVLLRPSGTEPLIRIFVESRSEELNNKIASMLKETIEAISMENNSESI
jgi:phosphoglucosamine mutase